MILWNAIMIGLKEIWAHKLRSLLTMGGIILGVSSLVTMAAIVKGMENGMKESLIAMGGLDKVRVENERLPDYQQHLRNQAPGKTLRDVYALRNSAPLIRLVSPEIRVSGNVTKGGKSVRPSECTGVWPEVLEMNMFELEHGRFFTQWDDEHASPVCVIGTGIRDELFGPPEETGEPIIPLGEVIHINGQAFTIVGMFKHYESEQARRAREAAAKKKAEDAAETGPKRQRGWRSRYWDAFWRKNNVVYIPLKTAWVRFEATDDEGAIVNKTLDDIDLKVADIDQMNEALQQARNVLMMTHYGIEDFEIDTQESELDSINNRIRNARISGGTIAALSLIVGGIGIMNIMLASINERIREIGTCKALGATGPAVFIQIVVESLVLSLLGAVVGLAASFGLVEIVTALTETAASSYTRGSSNQSIPILTAGAMLLGVVSSACVGVLAGILPAFKAAQLNPIEALRYE